MKPIFLKFFRDQSLNKLLNGFFNEFPEALEGCVFKENLNGHKNVMVIEESDMYYYLSGEFGWAVHTEFHELFSNTNWRPEMVNNCVVAFYKD